MIDWFGGSVTNNLLIRTDNKLTISGVSTTATTAAALSLATWYRLEWEINPSATVGYVHLSYYAGDSATLIETITVGNGNNGTSTTGAGYGNIQPIGTGVLYLDNIADKADAQVFPFPVNSVAPTVSGSAAVGSTLTATTGTWNGTFTYTYQWTRDGSNIGSATSSTYATVGADVGHAVGCKVTATGPVVTTETATQASSNTISVTGGAYSPGFRYGFL